MGATITHLDICTHCRLGGGSFWRVTYAGAPDGGVPVHVKCTPAFFEAIDQQPIKWTPRESWKLI
jgi:hypothetical protein